MGNRLGGPHEIFGPDETQVICEMYVAGFSLRQIAKQMHCSKSAVARQLRRKGIKIRPKGGNGEPLRGISHQHIETLRYLYEYEKLSGREIAARLGMKKGTVLYRLKQAGIPRRSISEANTLSYARGKSSLNKTNGYRP